MTIKKIKFYCPAVHWSVNNAAELEEAFNNGTVLTGKVKETVQAGMVIDLGGGYDGLCPVHWWIFVISLISMSSGQEVSFKIIEMRKEREKLILFA